MAVPDRRTEKTAAAPPERAVQAFLGYRIRRALVALQADLAEVLRPHDLRMITYTALMLVRESPGLSQAQLAGLMDMERPNLVAIVEELSRRGLISRGPAPADRRAYALHLTEVGAARCAEATAAVAIHEARLTEGLSDADRRVLDAALTQIRRNAERG